MTDKRKDQIKSQMIKGDLTFITSLTKKRGLNKGQGFTFNYVNRILALRNRNNEDIWALAEEITKSRKQLETI